LLNQREAWRNLQSRILNLKSQLSGFQSEISDLRSAVSHLLTDRSLHWLLHPPRIAIIGIPNAGKSTLANALLGRQHSIVSDTPGTTRDYVEELADLSGLAVQLVDTPGLRASEDQIEMAAIGISKDQIESADLQILLLDPTQPEAPQRELAAKYPRALRIGSKSDIAADAPPGGLAAALRISATTGEGLPELDLAIRHRFGCEELPHSRPCIWTQRQRDWIHDHFSEP
jgi:tRNA modification GTPase